MGSFVFMRAALSASLLGKIDGNLSVNALRRQMDEGIKMLARGGMAATWNNTEQLIQQLTTLPT